MKNISSLFAALLIVCVFAISCSKSAPEMTTVEAAGASLPGQSAVRDDESQKNIVQIAVGSPDHTTLVAALKAAEYVDVLSNAGPFTVFAPTNAAFAKLPEGTLDNLVKPENKMQLRDILEYHVFIGVIRENMIRSNMSLNQVNGKNVALSRDGGKITVNGASVIATVPTSNGIIYVTDAVLLPQ